MDLSWALFAGLSTAASAAGFLAWRLARPATSDSETDPEWLLHFSAARYRPMQRMLSDDDATWLAAQGMEPAAIRRLRTERRKIFGLYLDNLERDFERLHSAARAILMESQVDRPELADQLIRLKIDFQRNMFRVRVKLALHSLGFGNVDVSFLVRAIDGMHLGWQELASATSVNH
jgi:hypothetical protein